MIAFRQPGNATSPVEIWVGDRFIAALRPAPEVQRLQFAVPLRPAATEQYLRGWVAGALANQGRGDLVVAAGFDGARLSSAEPCAGVAPGTGVSSLTSATVAGDAAKTPEPRFPGQVRDAGPGRPLFEDETPYSWIARVYGLVYRPGDRVRAMPFGDMTGTVEAPPDGADGGGRVVAVVADGCGSPMHWHPCDLVRLVDQSDRRGEAQR